jgi:predicted ATP-grasp superfamily ATP-dependent carboligase
MKERGVIVIGGHVQGLGVVRIFGRNQIQCFVLDNTSINIARHSRYCTKFIKFWPDQDFVKFLIDLCERYDLHDWLLIPTDDNYVKILSQNKNTLEEYYRVSVDNWDVIEKCYNKRFTYKLVHELGVFMPKTFFPDSYYDLESIDLDYPCIIKPAIMHKLYSQIRKKVLICNNKNELSFNYKKVLSYIPADEIIVQEIIPGDSSNQYSACFFFDRTKSLVRLLARRKRQYPIDFGSCTSFAETINDPCLIEVAEKILKNINYWGICEVEFKRDGRDGKYKFLEINPRTWKWHSISTVSGSPFLMSLYNYVYRGKPILNDEWVACSWKDLVIDTIVLIRLL